MGKASRPHQHRWHLNESQRAMVAEKIANLQQGSNQHAPIGATSQTKAAELLNVGIFACVPGTFWLIAPTKRAWKLDDAVI